MAKTFEECTLREIHDWYLRLLAVVKKMVGEDSLAALMLERYLNPHLVSSGYFTIPDRFLDKLKNREETIKHLKNSNYSARFSIFSVLSKLKRYIQRTFTKIGCLHIIRYTTYSAYMNINTLYIHL